MSPKVVLISLDGATNSIVNQLFAKGALDPNTGLGLLKSKGVAMGNQTVTPSLTAPGHIAIATGSTAANNDIEANTFHLIANPFTTNTSGFAAPIGGYTYQTGQDPAEDSTPTATPVWASLQAVGKKVVAATFPGADGANIKSSTGIILDKATDRTVSYTIPFGAFAGVGGKGYALTAANFTVDATQAIAGLNALGVQFYGDVKVANLETLNGSTFFGGSTATDYKLEAAAIDTTNDNTVNYDTVVVFDANVGITKGTGLPTTGSAFLKFSDQKSSPFYYNGTNNKAGGAFFLSALDPSLSTVHIARYSADYIPRPAESPGVVANVDDINNNIGFWADQADYRFPERLNPGLSNFSDAELEAIYEDQVKTFVDYQTKVLLRSIQQNPNADLVLGYIEQPDGSEHQFLLTDPRQPTDFTNPNSIGTGQDPAKVARYQTYVQTAYQVANAAVQNVINAVGVDANGVPNSNVIVVSDHGFAPFHTAVSINNLLKNSGDADLSDSTKVRAVSSGPAVNIYINVQGREPNGTVAPADYPAIQQKIISLLQGFKDTNPNYAPNGPVSVFDKVYSRPVPANPTANDIINATSAYIGQDGGDVLALLSLGYNFDGTQSTPVIRKDDSSSTNPVLSVPNFYGAHGYDPTLPEMQAIFYAAGPNIKPGAIQQTSIQNIDVAPTLEKILGVTPAATVNGTALAGVTPSSLSLYNFTNLPKLGTVGGQDIFLGGFSGLAFQGVAANGNLQFVTLTDRGPNADIPGSSDKFFLLPNFQPEVVSFELNQTTGNITITKETKLFRQDGTTPLTGLPNLRAGAVGTAYTDDVGKNPAGQDAGFDTLGGDFESIVVAPNGDLWMSDEYRPAIYHFDAQGKLIDRFIPIGNATDSTQNGGTFYGTPVLPAVYAQRRANRGFEGMALQGNKLYAFIQSPIDNPDVSNDATSKASSIIRILEFDTVSKQVTGEYLYVLNDRTKADKIGDAVSLGNRRFAVVERDSNSDANAQKLIFQIDLTGATNVNNPANLVSVPQGKTLEQLTATDLAVANIKPVTKTLIANAAQLGYTGIEKLEGLTLVDDHTLAIVNDNDFNITGAVKNTDGTLTPTLSATPIPEVLGLIHLNNSLTAAPVGLAKLTFLGQATFPAQSVIVKDSTGTDTTLGGLSGITYDPSTKKFYSISDDRKSNANEPGQPTRFYTLNIDLSSGVLDNSKVSFPGVTYLRKADGSLYTPQSTDTEDIGLTNRGTVFISSEGQVDAAGQIRTNPFVNEYRLSDGQLVKTLPIPTKFLPDSNQAASETRGTYDNLAFESVAITPDQHTLYTATENALIQDGQRTSYPGTDPQNPSGVGRARILKFNLDTNQASGEFLYQVDPTAVLPSQTPGGVYNFQTAGLVALTALDNNGNFLAVERSFSSVSANTPNAPETSNVIKIYQVSIGDATDISNISSLNALSATDLAQIKPVTKQLVLNLNDLKLPTGLDNIEGITFGPVVNGKPTLVLVADDNFNKTYSQNTTNNTANQSQFTQILAFNIDVAPKTPLPNGVASGDVDQDSAVLWTHSTTLGTVTFEYSTTADFKTIAGTKTATVTDTTVPVKVEVTGLTAGTPYYYRVTDPLGATATGQFKTAAALGTHTGLDFGVSGDWRGELAPYPAVSNVAAKNLDFFVEHGDTIYADYPSNAVLNADGTPKDRAVTLAEYRAKHNEVYSDRLGLNTLVDLRRSTPILATFDDHEVTNDFAGGQNLATADATTQKLFGATSGLVNDSPLYENGLQAFQDYNPIVDAKYSNTGDPNTDEEWKTYRYQTYGSDASVITLDTRTFRDAELTAPASPTDTKAVTQTLLASLTQNRTLLGATQLADLKHDLLDAQAKGVTWKFVMIPEPIQNILPGITVDSYEGYGKERTELLKFIQDNAIQNVVFIAADVHSTYVNNLTYQTVTPTGIKQTAVPVFEVTTGPVAFDPPTGQILAQVAGAQNPQFAAAYAAAPVAPDTDSLPNDKDDLVKTTLNSQVLDPGGFDHLGLNDNLPQAKGMIDAQLLKGDYYLGHNYGWTEFNIDKNSQALTVTVYGISAYTQAQINANPQSITSAQPQVLSQFVVKPNVAPVVTAQNFALAAKNAVAGAVVGTVAATDSNTDQQALLKYSLTDAGNHFAIDAATGQLSVKDATGLDLSKGTTLSVTVTDPDGAATTAQVTVNNQAPTLTSSNTFSVAENSTTVGTVTVTDPENDPITLILAGVNADLFTLDPTTHVLSFNTAPDFETPKGGANKDSNIYQVTVQASDGINPAVSQPLTITVTNVNEAPKAVNDTVTLTQGSTALVRPLTNDGDPDANTTLTIASQTNGKYGTVINNGDGTLTYTPNANLAGTDQFTYTVSDGSLTATAKVTVTVNPKQDATQPVLPPGQVIPLLDGDDLLKSIKAEGGSLKDVIDRLEYQVPGNVAGSRVQQALQDAVKRTDAAFKNILGLYQVDDLTGAIDGVNPGDSGYAQKALVGRLVTDFNLRLGGNTNTSTPTLGNFIFNQGKIYAPFAIAHGGDLGGTTLKEIITNFFQQNPNNAAATKGDFATKPVTYFGFGAANPDKTAHLKNLGNNVFGFEDLPAGVGVSDNDFNDAVFSFGFVTP